MQDLDTYEAVGVRVNRLADGNGLSVGDSLDCSYNWYDGEMIDGDDGLSGTCCVGVRNGNRDMMSIEAAAKKALQSYGYSDKYAQVLVIGSCWSGSYGQDDCELILKDAVVIDVLR